MGLKILLQNVMHEDEMGPGSKVIWDGLRRLAEKVAKKDTAVTLRHLEKEHGAPGSMNWPCLQLLRDAAVVSGALKAEEEGFDAVVIGCALDSGLHQARGMLDIPVTGAAESGLMVAQLLGSRSAVIAPGDILTATIEQNIRFLGFEDRVIKYKPVRHFDMMPGLIDAFRGNPERLIGDFERVAVEAICDGADVIIPGCAWLGSAFSLNGYTEVHGAKVPVVDGAAAALKMAELLAELRGTLGLKKSGTVATSLYRTPPKELLLQARKEFARALE